MNAYCVCMIVCAFIVILCCVMQWLGAQATIKYFLSYYFDLTQFENLEHFNREWTLLKSIFAMQRLKSKTNVCSQKL